MRSDGESWFEQGRASDPLLGRDAATYAATRSGARFTRPWTFAWKTAVLFLATVALIPILLYRNELAATLYIVALVVIHVVGLFTFAYGVRRHDIAPTRRGLWGRIAGLAFAIGLLFLAEKGLRTDTGAMVFWWSLFAIWALHTGGLALLHFKTKREVAACPFA